MNTEELIDRFAKYSTGNPGIESLVSHKSDPLIINRLLSVDIEPLTKVQLNQLLGLSMEIGVSEAFFSFYWNAIIPGAYDPRLLDHYSADFEGTESIISLEHLLWGLTRIYIDGLFVCGNVRMFFRGYASHSLAQLEALAASLSFDSEGVLKRGPALPFASINKDDRYLIAEQACKSYGESPVVASDLKTALLDAFHAHRQLQSGPIKIKDLLGGTFITSKYHAQDQKQLVFSADEYLEDEIASDADIELKYTAVAERFMKARSAALENTAKYLSLVNDLDVYVATSMRNRSNFRQMADTCDEVFGHALLADLHLRFFDPTISAAEGHQDKGIIECLMVKCAKVLVYCAGISESYGKDAEASMALSLGKPVIFLCEDEAKAKFYREVHPLSRLINFNTGVAVGAMVTHRVDVVRQLLSRIFRNKMEYILEQPKPGYLVVKEKLTASVVRLQTNDAMLSEAFWNYYRAESKTYHPSPI